ncbi:MAG TPA: glycoside hydrolase family protein [Planctomycetota bacterium]|nr:glycoside hydrolase family protein [Planctomycetota bacterium]
MANLEQLLKEREGVKKKVYLDSRGKPTVGIGHLVTTADKLKVGDTITDQQVSAFFKKDSAAAVAAANSQASQAGISDSDFKVYLASVNFQLGTSWNTIHKKTWKLIMEKKYEEAAVEAGKSAWASQTPVRVKDFQKALRALVKVEKK